MASKKMNLQFIKKNLKSDKTLIKVRLTIHEKEGKGKKRKKKVYKINFKKIIQMDTE